MKYLSLIGISLATILQQVQAGEATYCMYDQCPPMRVPEAGTIGMLGLGIAAVVAVRYFRKK